MLSPEVCLNDMQEVLDEKWLRAFDTYLALVGYPCEGTVCLSVIFVFTLRLKIVYFLRSFSLGSLLFLLYELQTHKNTPQKH